MRFEPTRERSLDIVAENAVAHLPGASNGTIAIREMTGPRGIPDLTVLTNFGDQLDARLDSNIRPILNEIDAAIISRLSSKRGQKIESIASSLGWHPETIIRRMSGLVREGAAQATSKELYVRHPALIPVGTVTVIEQKIDDFTSALYQARGYAVWSDAYVIVMNSLSNSARQSLRREVQADRGGLILDGSWIVRPRARVQRSRERRIWASEHFIAALLSP